MEKQTVSPFETLIPTFMFLAERVERGRLRKEVRRRNTLYVRSIVPCTTKRRHWPLEEKIMAANGEKICIIQRE